jgi:hypothetical protein
MRGGTSMLAFHLLPVEDLLCAGELHASWSGNTLDFVLQGLGDAQVEQQTAKLRGNNQRLLTIGAELRSCSNGLWLFVWVIGVTQGSVIRWVIAVTLAVDDILLVLWLSKFHLLRLSRLLLLLWLSRFLLLLWLSGLQLLLWLSSLLWLARGTSGWQLPDGKMTSSALMSGTTNVNHLQFGNRRV